LTPAVEQLDAVPSLRRLYPRAVAASARPAIRRLPGVPAADAKQLPELSLRGAEIDRGNLIAYARVCGFRLRDRLPPTYLHLLAFPLSMRIMTSPSFPLPVIGLVHVRNRIEHLRPVDASKRPDVRVRADHLERQDRGTQFQILAEATIDGEPVWRSASTYLRRGDGGSRSRRRSPEPQTPAPGAMWRVPADTGRRYAAVSGDINPIHLHPLTARLFGLPGAIAHGMWLKARCLAALDGELPDAHVADVSFRQPVGLPSRVGFAAWRADGRREFALEDWSRGRKHLTGEVTAAG
jgi:acyl dehydratase